MAFAFVQSFTSVSGTGATRVLVKPATAAGAILMLPIAFASNNRDVSSVNDDVGGSWTRATPFGGIASTGMGAYFCYNAPTSAGNITITFDSSSVSGVVIAGEERSGILTASALDQSSALAITGSASSITATTSATTQATECSWTFARSESTSRPLTTPTGYTVRTSLDSGAFATADNRLVATGTQSVQWPVTGGNAAIGAMVLTFKEITAAGAPLFLPEALGLSSMTGLH